MFALSDVLLPMYTLFVIMLSITDSYNVEPCQAARQP